MDLANFLLLIASVGFNILLVGFMIVRKKEFKDQVVELNRDVEQLKDLVCDTIDSIIVNLNAFLEEGKINSLAFGRVSERWNNARMVPDLLKLKRVISGLHELVEDCDQDFHDTVSEFENFFTNNIYFSYNPKNLGELVRDGKVVMLNEKKCRLYLLKFSQFGIEKFRKAI